MTIQVTTPEGLPLWVGIAINLVFFLGLIALMVISTKWAMNDAERRGKPGCLVAILVFFTWPIGLLFWLVARPEPRIVLRPPPLPRE